MLKLYYFHKFDEDLGNFEEVLDGLFIADESDVNGIIGKKISTCVVVDEVSEIYGENDEYDIKIITDDQKLINKLVEIFKLNLDISGTISGFNPLDYMEVRNK